MLTPDKIKALLGYKKIPFICDKCKIKTVFETDYLTETQVKQSHKCKKEKVK